MTQRITKKIIEQYKQYLSNTYNENIIVAKSKYVLIFGVYSKGGFAPFLCFNKNKYKPVQWLREDYFRKDVDKALNLILRV